MKSKKNIFIVIMMVNFIYLKCAEKSIAVVIPSYKNAEWYVRNLDSVYSQNYSNYKVYYTDDCSPDGTGDLVKKYIKDKNQEFRTNLVINKERSGPLANRWRMVWQCEDGDIVVFLDGDDWLANPDVFKKLNDIYSDPNVWMTYGQLEWYPSDQHGQYCRPLPDDVVDNAGYRKIDWYTTHLRTCYAWLFKQIKFEDLLYKDKFFLAATDLAFMYPMLEMSARHTKFIPDLLYIYNCASPINIPKVNGNLQDRMASLIRQKHRYTRLDSPKIRDFDSYKIDLVVVSLDNPLQLYLLLESIEFYIKGLGSIFISYKSSNEKYNRAYKMVESRFPYAKFIRQNDDLISILDSADEYVLLSMDNIVVKDYIDLKNCLKVMEQTQAHMFFLGLGKNLQQINPNLISVYEDIKAWWLRQGDFKYTYNLGMTLYRKKNIKECLLSLINSDFSDVLNSLNDNIKDKQLGLCFAESKAFAANLEGENKSQYTKEELLSKFELGLKIDFKPLFKIKNEDYCVKYKPNFIVR